MLIDLIILAVIIAFVCVAALGHILLGLALLAGRKDRRASADNMAAPAAVVMPSHAINNSQPTADRLAA